MQTRIKTNISEKKRGVEKEWQDYEYDIKNEKGEKFHVTVHREIEKLSRPELELEEL